MVVESTGGGEVCQMGLGRATKAGWRDTFMKNGEGGDIAEGIFMCRLRRHIPNLRVSVKTKSVMETDDEGSEYD